jgi:Protein of unknown function (DUF1573)
MSNKKPDGKTAKRRSGRSWRTLNRLFVAGFAALAIAAVAFLAMGNRQSGGASPEQVASATGTLSAAQTFHDFGQVSMRDGKISYRYTVRNDSDAPALVEQIYTSCMCTEASLLLGSERVGPFGMPGMGPPIPTINRVIPPGQQAVIVAEFDPNAHGPAGIGRNDRVVSVVMGERRVLQLGFTAFVTP